MMGSTLGLTIGFSVTRLISFANSKLMFHDIAEMTQCNAAKREYAGFSRLEMS